MMIILQKNALKLDEKLKSKKFLLNTTQDVARYVVLRIPLLVHF